MCLVKKIEMNKGYYEDNILPKGFYEWYIILVGLQNETLKQINGILEANDFFGAKTFFEVITIDNQEKIWH